MKIEQCNIDFGYVMICQNIGQIIHFHQNIPVLSTSTARMNCPMALESHAPTVPNEMSKSTYMYLSRNSNSLATLT